MAKQGVSPISVLIVDDHTVMSEGLRFLIEAQDDLADLFEGQIKCLLPQLVHKLPGLLRAAGVRLKLVMDGQTHRSFHLSVIVGK